MEMSGNVSEIVVYAGVTESRNFDGQHGDGMLSANAEANTPRWESSANNYIMTARGGNFTETIDMLQISNRASTTLEYTGNYSYLNGRGIRTAE
jgi:hypothetical protein